MLIIEFIVGVFIVRLVWKAFQGWCYNTGMTEAAGATKLLKFLVVATVIIGVGVLVLAAILSPTPGPATVP